MTKLKELLSYIKLFDGNDDIQLEQTRRHMRLIAAFLN